MFKTLPTFFGPVVTIKTDIRITQEIEKNGHWEFEDLLKILKVYEKFYAGRTGTILDIGCNIGSWLLPIAQRYQQNTLLAVDCQPLAIECVNQTTQLNRLTNVQTDCGVISDYIGSTVYNKINYEWGANFGAYEFETPYAESDFNGKTLEESDTIAVKTIDSLNLDHVVFIKLDIEGMELKALTGAVNTIQRDQPFIAFEHHKINRQQAEQLLRDLNYIIYDSIGQMTLAVPTHQMSLATTVAR